MSLSNDSLSARIALYEAELYNHQKVVDEYGPEINRTMLLLLHQLRPNIETLKQQPYMTLATRHHLLEYAYRILVRLKLLPFVYHRAIRIFDRYCSKRIVLAEQIRLIVTTCLWIAAKVHGGNNHFNTVPNTNKTTFFGPPTKFVSHPGRFRLPRLIELVNLCGSSCHYDVGMFKQMEVHILNTLQWQVSDPGIDDFICLSNESHLSTVQTPDLILEMHRTKEYLVNVSLTSPELIDISNADSAQVLLDFVNEVFSLMPNHSNYQEFVANSLARVPPLVHANPQLYLKIKRAMVNAVINSSSLSIYQLSSAGPRFLHQQVGSLYGVNSNGDGTSFAPSHPLAGSVCSSYNSQFLANGKSATQSLFNLPIMTARLVRSLGNVILQTVKLPMDSEQANSGPPSAQSKTDDYDLFEFGVPRRDLPASDVNSPFEVKFP